MQESFDPVRPDPARNAWGNDLWRWQPSQGRWSAERHGLPKTAVFVCLDTALEQQRNRYDYWRHTVLYDFDGHPRHGDGSSDFTAHVRGLAGPNGSLFSYVSDALSGERVHAGRLSNGCEDITIGFLHGGERRHSEGEDRTVTKPGQFYVYHAGRDSQVQCSKSHGTLMVIRRRAIETALGASLPSSSELARALTKSPLAPFLSSQMSLLAHLAESLSETDRAAMLQNTLDLLATVLRGTAMSGPVVEKEHALRRLLTAALGIIQASLSNPSLGPEMLTLTLGCSRAKLYRAFAEYGLTVSGAIREARLKQARAMIESLPPDVSIADIGMNCGFLDAANFSRNFRLYFGASPTELRGQG